MIVIDPDTYPILPRHIDASQDFGRVFHRPAMAVAALRVVVFCQHRAGWHPFTGSQIMKFCASQGHPQDFWLRELGRVGIIWNTSYNYVTHDFVARCFAAHPVIQAAAHPKL